MSPHTHFPLYRCLFLLPTVSWGPTLDLCPCLAPLSTAGLYIAIHECLRKMSRGVRSISKRFKRASRRFKRALWCYISPVKPALQSISPLSQ
ncbi:hypothetical protein CC2G_007828 [Coprinopsis cinerea AmutBmut pab1-1]|nr:hypothetical protein CC2G_007828 [Coprinopsis cinerea AmutBmut pab1-1]